MTRERNLHNLTKTYESKLIRNGTNSPRTDHGRLQLTFNHFNFERITGDVINGNYYIENINHRKYPFAPWTGLYLTLGNQTGRYGRSPCYIPNHQFKDLGFELRNKIASHDFNAMVSAMEGKSTIQGLHERAKRLAGAYAALRRGNLKGFGQALDLSIPPGKQKRSDHVRKNISGHLLEYQFGLLPLYQDMYNGAVHIYELSNWQPVKTFKTRFVQSIEQDFDMQDYTTPLHCQYGGDSEGFRDGYFAGAVKVTAKSKVTSRLMANVRVTNPVLSDVSSFGFNNPAQALWSVAPSSWILDAFLPIGDFLGQLYMPPGLSIDDCGSVQAIETDYTWPKLNVTTRSRYAEYDAKTGILYDKEQQLSKVIPAGKSHRVKISSSPQVFPGISFPSVQLPFVGQAISMMAYADLQAKRLKPFLKP